jgi:hypothetical protein
MVEIDDSTNNVWREIPNTRSAVILPTKTGTEKYLAYIHYPKWDQKQTKEATHWRERGDKYRHNSSCPISTAVTCNSQFLREKIYTFVFLKAPKIFLQDLNTACQ